MILLTHSKMNVFIRIITLLILAGFLAACKKDKKDEPSPATPVQSMSLRLTPMVGADTLKFNTSFTTENNVRYTVSSLRYYMSDISLIKKDGSEHALEGKFLLVNANTSSYTLGDVPAGEYKGIRFSIGLNNVVNHLDPTIYPTSHPLAIQSPGIHWSWNSGYIFLSIEGTCDTTETNVDALTYGQYNHGMFFHVGMDPLLREVDLADHSFTVSSTEAKVLNIQYNVNALFSGVNLKTENKSHTMGSMPLATKVADNIPDMFTIKE